LTSGYIFVAAHCVS